jgi:glycerol-3-phosphate acyltransferase PlsY
MSPLPVKILFAAASYLAGAFPTGYLLVRARQKKDIRDFGSGATGATNVMRLQGWRGALPVALVDIFKGFLPAFTAARLFPDPAFPALCASLAVIGHCFPVYIGFRGGKGVATAAGAMLAIAPAAAGMSLAVFVLTVVLTRYVSLGSVLAALAFPGFLLIVGAPFRTALWSLPLLAVILVRHAGNLRRLLSGTERKLGRKEPAP